MENSKQTSPVGGKLANHVEMWEKIHIADKLVLKIVAQGLKLELWRRQC